MEPFVSAEWLADRLEQPQLRIVDCRFELGDPGAGRRTYLAGHIPGAAFLDLDADLSARPAIPGPNGPVGGRHPLPQLERFASCARRAGIGAGTTVVAYDEADSGGAARLWWLLRHCGFDTATVLDGGIAAWSGPLNEGDEPIEPGDFTVGEVRDDVVDADAIAADRPLVLDARAPERFRGEVEPIDPVAGHIPGARNVPSTDPLPDDLPRDVQLVASCGSGVTACALLLKLAEAGREDAKLYAGSWSDWIARGLPVATEIGRSSDEDTG